MTALSPENAAASATLDAWLAKIQQLPKLPEQAAPDVATAMRAEAHRTIAAGTTAYGAPWKLTAEGDKPLRNAAEAVGVAAVGASVVMVVRGIEGRHHKGTVRGKVARPIIPFTGLPGPMADQVRHVFERHFTKVMT